MGPGLNSVNSVCLRIGWRGCCCHANVKAALIRPLTYYLADMLTWQLVQHRDCSNESKIVTIKHLAGALHTQTVEDWPKS